MVESVEHRFLTNTVTKVLSELATSKLYTYREAERGRLDFACRLAEDWTYLVSGQTLWKHEEFIDRDIRSLLVAEGTPIGVYVVLHTTKNRAVLQEALTDYKRGPLGPSLARLKVFWIAPFDGNDENDRRSVENQLYASVTEDILFNVVFGRLGPADARGLARSRGVNPELFGLELAMLVSLTARPFGSINDLAGRFPVSRSTIRDRVTRLLAWKFLEEAGAFYQISSSGRALLRICAELFRCSGEGVEPSAQLAYIVEFLDKEPVFGPDYDDGRGSGVRISLREALTVHAIVAAKRWGARWELIRLPVTNT